MKTAVSALRLALTCTCCAGLLTATLAFAQTTRSGDQKPVGPPASSAGPHDKSVQISEYVRCIFQDRKGNLWFGTNSDGVCRYDGKALVYLSMKDGLAGRAV